MNPLKRLGHRFGNMCKTWLQKVAEENRPIEQGYETLPFDDHSEENYLTGVERDELDSTLWKRV